MQRPSLSPVLEPGLKGIHKHRYFASEAYTYSGPAEENTMGLLISKPTTAQTMPTTSSQQQLKVGDFHAPSPSDLRSPCPALDILAHHG